MTHDDEIRDLALSYQKQVWNAALRHARDRAEAEEFFQETYRRAFESGGLRATAQQSAAWWKALGPKVGGFVEASAIGTKFANLGDRQIDGGGIGWEFALTAIGDIQAAEARRAQAGIDIVRVRDLVAAEVIRAHEDLRVAAEQIDIAQRGVTAAEATLTLSQSRYADGVGLALDVLEAERALTVGRTALVTAIQAYNSAQVALLWATGELSPGTLAADG